jgi:8-oxo-dGTP pyrophosphatase MutT (NUDIX family)
MTEVSERSEDDRPGPHRNLIPKDAATLILLDRTGPTPKVLMGKRHHGHVFMPSRFVFPGGRVDPDDRRMTVGAPLDPRAEERLMRRVRRPSVAKARALALAAIRETYEETGLFLGRKSSDAQGAAGPLWSAFAEAQVQPDLSKMHFIARAITPPGNIRRFDTRFFTAEVSAVAHRIDGMVGPDAELVELIWVPLTETGSLNLLAITARVLQDLQNQIEAGFSHDLPVPFYRSLHGRRVRELL